MGKSFNINDNQKAIEKSGQQAGRSGEFFITTFDKKYIIKTISESEFKVFNNILY